MTSSQPTNVDARGSTINNVGRDQNYCTINIAIHANSTSEIPLQHIIQNVAGAANATASASNGGFQIQMQNFHQQAMIVAEDASGLIVSIVQLLVNRTDSSDTYRDTKQFLELLNHTILMSRLALQTFEYTSLGRNLAKAILPTIAGCRTDLQELLHLLDNYREGLSYTSVRELWSRVLWSGSDIQEILIIKQKLSTHQISLREFLAALNSCVCCFCL